MGIFHVQTPINIGIVLQSTAYCKSSENQKEIKKQLQNLASFKLNAIRI